VVLHGLGRAEGFLAIRAGKVALGGVSQHVLFEGAFVD
jgi:hypothetical protein